MLKRAAVVLTIAGTVFSGAFTYSPVNAQTTTTGTAVAGFDPNYILSDDDIFNVNAFPYDRLVEFLRSKGTLADYRTPDIDGIPKTVPEIIWRVATSYKINPKYLVALIQKEQSLVEDPNPTQNQFDWAAGYGVCDSCSKNDPSIQDFKGFASQVEWAAKQFREKYLIQLLSRGLTIGGQGMGKAVHIDGQIVTPVNNATAMLYSYTPHINGNFNLWRIWHRWFNVSYPDGTVVLAKPSNVLYLLHYGEKRPFASRAVLASMYDATKIVNASDSDLASYQTGTSVKFAKYSLLSDPKGNIYLLTDSGKRLIAGKAAFRKFNFNSDEIEDATAEDLAQYPDGPPITTKTVFPQGVLVKTNNSKSVWYAEDGVRHPIVDAVLIKLYFQGRHIQTVTQKALDALTVGDPYRLRDGELVRSASTPSVYVVEDGMLRPIPSANVFTDVGWKWGNIVTVPDRVLALHQVGQPFTITNSDIQLTQAP